MPSDEDWNEWLREVNVYNVSDELKPIWFCAVFWKPLTVWLSIAAGSLQIDAKLIAWFDKKGG